MTDTATALETEAIEMMERHLERFQAWGRSYLADVETFGQRLKDADIPDKSKAAITQKLLRMADQLTIGL
jgi:hypothetical protein